jgi:hypothetical protein
MDARRPVIAFLQSRPWFDSAVPRDLTCALAAHVGFDVPSSQMLALSDVARATADALPPARRVPFPPPFGGRPAAATAFSSEDVDAIAAFVNPAARWATSTASTAASSLLNAFRHLVVLSAAADALADTATVAALRGAGAPAAVSLNDAVSAIDAAESAADLAKLFASRPEVALRMLWESVASPRAQIGPATRRAPLSVDAVMLMHVALATGAAPLLLQPESGGCGSGGGACGRGDASSSVAVVHAAATAGLMALALALPSPGAVFFSRGGGAAAPAAAPSAAFFCAAVHHAAPALVANRAAFVRMLRPTTAAEAATLCAVLFGIDLCAAGDSDAFVLANGYKVFCDAQAVAGGAEAAAALAQIDAWFAPVAGSALAPVLALSPHHVDIRVTWSPAWARLYSTNQELFFGRKAGIRVGAHVTTDESPATGAAAAADAAGAAGAGVRRHTTLRHALFAVASELPSVFVGAHPRAANAVSPISLEPIRETVSEHGPCSVLTFSWWRGGAGDLTFTAISVFDVMQTIRASESLALALSSDDPAVVYLTKRTVVALTKMAEDLSSSDAGALPQRLSRAAADAYAQLLAVVRAAADRARNVTGHTVELANAVANANAVAAAAAAAGGGDADGRQVTEAFRALFRLAMFMRGWRGGDAPLPLRSVDTTYDASEQAAVEIRVAAAIIEYDEAVAAISDANLRRLVKSAPLLSARRTPKSGGAVFVPMRSAEQGLTVEDRLAIVREGENGTIFSCLRMSSNLIAATAFHNLVYALRVNPPPMDISALDEIM